MVHAREVVGCGADEVESEVVVQGRFGAAAVVDVEAVADVGDADAVEASSMSAIAGASLA